MACLALVIFTTPHLYLSTSRKADVLLLQKQLFGKLFIFFISFFFSLKANTRNVSVSLRDALLHQNLVHDGPFPQLLPLQWKAALLSAVNMRVDGNFVEACSFLADCGWCQRLWLHLFSGLM